MQDTLDIIQYINQTANGNLQQRKMYTAKHQTQRQLQWIWQIAAGNCRYFNYRTSMVFRQALNLVYGVWFRLNKGSTRRNPIITLFRENFPFKICAIFLLKNINNTCNNRPFIV